MDSLFRKNPFIYFLLDYIYPYININVMLKKHCRLTSRIISYGIPSL